jgi:hypothetical protein
MTKKLLFVTTILLALSMAAFAADVTGKWTFEQQGRGGNPTTVTLNLKAEGSSVSGMLSQPGRNGVTESKISDGKIEGNNLSFKVSRQMGDNTITTEYMGTVNGDTISLKITSPGRGDGAAPTVREATAKRATT